MTLLALPLGLVLPTLSGWLMLSLLEWKTPVLFTIERWVLGFVVGLTGTMYVTFLAHALLHLPLSFVGFLSMQIIFTGVLGGLFVTFRPTGEQPKPVPAGKLQRWQIIAIAVLGLWTLLKIASGTMILTMTPTFFDDSIDNWNLRGKIIFVTKTYPLVLPFGIPGQPDGVSSYPPTVPMSQAWLASVAGEWNEGLINAIHLVYYLATLGLLFFSLRRYLSGIWSLLGTYMLSSLPLYLLHGTSTYADGFMSMHVFAAVSLLLHAGRSRNRSEIVSCMRLAALAGALLAFTKNEGFGLYLPPLLVLTGMTIWWKWKKSNMLTRQDSLRLLSVFAVLLLAIAGPWTAYKLYNGLVFGNAHPIGAFALTIRPMALISIAITTFFEGNWLLLFPLVILVLALSVRHVCTSALIIPVVFMCVTYVTQLGAFLFFASLSTELIKQTGYARGVIHLLPVMVFLVTMLLQNMLDPQENG